MQAIKACRTEALGGHVYTCPSCQFTRYSYHSCRNRHCPTCQQDATQAWLAEQHMLLLPVPYFLVTFTLPSELRALARQQPETLYPLLLRTSAAALQQLAQDPRFLGGQIGISLRLADLDTRPALPPARPLSGAGVGPDARWQTLAGRQQRFPDACQTTWPAVSSEISRGLAPDGVG